VKVLIAGAGIAGPAAAIALAKAGICSEVFEAHAEEADATGAFLTLTANGQDALRAIGAEAAMTAASFPATWLRLFGPSGELLADAPPRPLPTRARAPSPAPHCPGCCAHRPLTTGSPFTTASAWAAADTGPDGRVTATFADGTRATADLLIGADGIHSPVRDADRPRRACPALHRPDHRLRIQQRAAARGRRDRGIRHVLRQPRVLRLHRRPRRPHLVVRPRPRPAARGRGGHAARTGSPPRSTPTPLPRRGSSGPAPAR